MDSITLSFNVDIARVQQLGIDPTTSEGKAALQRMFLELLGVVELDPEEWSEEELKILQEFLKEV
jgi:hypothetical protein